MSFMRWDESPHWAKSKATAAEPVELPPALTLRSEREIIDAIRDDPRYNAINPTDQQHIIDMAIESARVNGTLIL